MAPQRSRSRRKSRPVRRRGIASRHVGGQSDSQSGVVGVAGGDALQCFLVLLICARPLAGPPVTSTGRPVVGSLQARTESRSAVHRDTAGIRRETSRNSRQELSRRRSSPSPLIRPASPLVPILLIGVIRIPKRNRPNSAPASANRRIQPSVVGLRQSSWRCSPFHVHRHPWEEAGYVPVLRP
jgi:hypothetical protein